jgi:NAD(P)-dependent dehydrogenase (short-subunit alcohol dehydrogenase family)
MASVYSTVPFDAIDEHAWNAVLDVDLRAAFLCARAAVPHMRRGGGGRIINFSDWVAASGRPRYPGFLPYYVAKAGAKALTEALALELAGDQILVNAIAPGPIVAPPGTTEEEQRAVEAATPLGRWGGTDAIVRAVVFLIETDFVTGETIRVDGGRHIK